MPIFTKDFSWTETESQVYILLPLKGTNPSKAAIISTDNYLRVNLFLLTTVSMATVTFTPFIFEAFLKNAVDDAKSIAKVIRGTVEFTLFKLVAGLWGVLSQCNLDKTAIFERRNAAEVEMKAKAEAKSKDRADRRYKQREYAVNQQIELECADKDRIKKLKDKENEDVANYLRAYNEENDSSEKKYEKDLLKEPPTIVEKQKSCDASSAVEVLKEKSSEEKSKVQSKGNEDLYKLNLPPIIFSKKKKRRKPKIEFPAPRVRCDIPVKFTPRAFPTAARESQAEEERLWLEKQAEARRMNVQRGDENFKPEECDPEWLKEKGECRLVISGLLGSLAACFIATASFFSSLSRVSPAMSTEESCLKQYSLKEVSDHDSRKSVWIVIHDLVYDVTPFLDEHPGGEEILLEQAGKNATENFEDVGHSTDAREMMKKFIIGEVIDEEKIDNKEPEKPDIPDSSDSDNSWRSWLFPKAAKSDSGFLHRLKSVSISNKNNTPQGFKHRDQHDVDDDTHGYASLTSINQYECAPSTSTSQQPVAHNSSLEYFISATPEKSNVIYAKPNKKKSASLPTIELVHHDRSDSDEIVTLSQINGDSLSLQMSSDEKNRNINSLITLSTVLKDNQKSFLHDDTHENRKSSVYLEGNSLKQSRQENRRVDLPTVEESLTVHEQENQDVLHLKAIIFRLIDLLKKYQPEISIENVSTNFEDVTGYSWPIDVKYLAPLFLAYDNKLKEKDEIIQHQEAKLIKLQLRQQEETKQRLYHINDDKQIQIQLSKWKLMCEEANFEMQAFKRKEVEDKEKIQKILQQLIELKDENNSLQSKIADFKMKSTQTKELQCINDKLMSRLTSSKTKNMKLKEKHRSTLARLNNCISEDKHLKIIDKIKENFVEKKEKSAEEIYELRRELKENKENLSKYAAEKCHLEGQNSALTKILRSVERKSTFHEEQYTRNVDEFAVARDYLESTELTIAGLKAERDSCVKIIEQLKGKMAVLKHRRYKTKTNKKKKRVLLVHKPVQNEHKECEKEIKRLQHLLDEERSKFQSIVDAKIKLETDLELVWRVCSTENQLTLNHLGVYGRCQ
uniref:cytochrome-b5 reductase n=1 Tax=Strigamia maritima TaxID=126957 RepID=T1J559_STRMM